MPPKPKHRSNNKKKNKNKAKGRAGHGRQKPITTGPMVRIVGGRSRPSAEPMLDGMTPTYWKALQDGNATLHEEFPTAYSQYKKATHRFIEYMAKECPSEMGERCFCSANSLLAAADWMAQTDHVMERSVLRDLKLAIRVRSRIAASVYSAGDTGHQHFLNVLTYCWCVLNTLPNPAVEKSEKTKSQEDTTNSFAAFMEEDNGDDGDYGDVDEKMFPSIPVLRPESSGPEPLSLDDLMKSDGRHDAIIFLMTLNEMMGSIAQHYKGVVKNYARYERIGAPSSAIIENLMEAAVTTNMAIQQVQKLEMDLMVQHEHLTNPYRLLATLVFPELVQNLTATVREHAASEGCTEKDITIYLGDCVESYHRTNSDPYNRKEDIVKDFCRRWQVDSVGTSELEEMFSMLQQYVILEVPIGFERENRAHFDSILRPTLGDAHDFSKSHSWIRNMPYIGGDRAIHHTLRLLQSFGEVVRKTHQNIQVDAVRGCFGISPWVAGQSHTIHNDLDELLMAEILPKWMVMCRKGLIGTSKLPREDELCPLFVLLRKYVEEPEKPVTWSLTFAIHALLTAVIEVDPIFDKLVFVSKTNFDLYFDQIDWAMKLANSNPESIGDASSPVGKTWWHNITSVSFLENLGLPFFGDRTLWNPLCAGTTLSYLNYFGNMEVGCALIDCHAQLRITLHLYHALLVNGIIKKGQLLILDMLFDKFRHSKAVWEGNSLPERGEFVYRFWLCFGYNDVDAKRMSDYVRKGMLEIHQVRQSNESFQGTRKLVPIEPAEISKSYRRICNRDFHDVVDKYHTPEQRRSRKDTDQYQFAVRNNDTLDAMEDEQKLLCLNLPACGAMLEQFVNSLGRILQWEPILQDWKSKKGLDQREGFALMFAQYLLGALDFADDPLRYKFMDVPMGEASSWAMDNFFGKFADATNTLWF